MGVTGTLQSLHTDEIPILVIEGYYTQCHLEYVCANCYRPPAVPQNARRPFDPITSRKPSDAEMLTAHLAKHARTLARVGADMGSPSWESGRDRGAQGASGLEKLAAAAERKLGGTESLCGGVRAHPDRLRVGGFRGNRGRSH